MTSDPRLLEATRGLFEIYQVGLRTGPLGAETLSNGDASRFGRSVLLGALVTLWEYADTFIGNDDTLPIGPDGVDALVGIEGFCDLLPDDWLLELDNGTVQLPGYCLKNQLVARRKRATDGKNRTAKWRAGNAKRDTGVRHGDPTVTRHGPVSKCADLDQDLDLKKKTQDKSGGSEQPPPLVLGGDQSLTPKLHETLPQAAWQQWLQYRRQRRLPMSPQALGLHLKTLSAHNPDTQVAMIEMAIANNWKGIFPPRHAAKAAYQAAPTTAELEAQEADRARK